MFLTNVNEASEDVQVDALVNKDPDTAEGAENIAKEIEDNMRQSALENVSYFENGEQALKEFANAESTLALLEARKMAKKTFVRLGKDDDLTRRTKLGCLILARENKDPLFDKLAKNRVMERKLRNAIYKRYMNKATRLAKISQKQHIKDMKKIAALPKITLN